MRLIPIVVAITMLASLSARARAEEPAKKYDPKAAFAETDTNHDGSIDREEFHVRIIDVFYSADTNKDGYLSPDEFVRLVFSDDFKQADKDGDGRVSLHEFLIIRTHQFDAVDMDHDGELSLDEVVAAYEGRKHQ